MDLCRIEDTLVHCGGMGQASAVNLASSIDVFASYCLNYKQQRAMKRKDIVNIGCLHMFDNITEFEHWASPQFVVSEYGFQVIRPM